MVGDTRIKQIASVGFSRPGLVGAGGSIPYRKTGWIVALVERDMDPDGRETKQLIYVYEPTNPGAGWSTLPPIPGCGKGDGV